MNKRYYGKTRLETIVVMLILLMFGISTYTLVLATTTSYEKSQNEHIAKDNLRLASSYIDSKIKHFEKNNIKIEKTPLVNSNAIILEENIEGDIYQTIIYFKDKSLKEIFIKKGTQLDDSLSFEIARLEDIQINKIKDRILELTFHTKANGNDYNTQTILNLE